MKNIDVKPVKWIDEVLQVALQHMPEPAAKPKGTSGDADDDSSTKKGTEASLRH